MQWVGGWYPFRDSTAPAPVALSARTCASAHGLTWSAGPALQASRSIKDAASGATLTVHGACYATDDQLALSLRRAADGDFSPLRMWPGQYLAVIERPDETVVIGDLSGVHQIYYVVRKGAGIWSNAATPLAALTGAGIDWSAVLTELAAVGYARFLGRTPFSGVMAVPPGSLLRLSATGVNVELWYEQSQVESLAEGAPAFSSALLEAISSRAAATRSWSCDLSGGIDSSTLATLAAMRRPVTAITLVNPWLTSEDMTCADEIARLYPRLSHVKIASTWDLLQFGGLSHLADPPVTDLPSRDLTALAQVRAMARSASHSGSWLHMSGEGGDCVAGSPAGSVVDLYRSNRRQAIRQVGHVARRNGCGNAVALGQIRRTAATTYPHELAALARYIETGARATSPITESLSRCSRLEGARWLTPKAAAMCAADLRQFAANQTDILPGCLHDWLSAQSITADAAHERLAFADLGISLEVPYMDARVLVAALAIPPYERGSGNGFKPLITRGLGELLPEVITKRSTKGEYALAAQRGAEASSDYLRKLAQTSLLIEQGLLKHRAVEDAFDLMIYGVEPMNAAIQQFVAIEYWLRTLRIERSTWWSPRPYTPPNR